MSYKKTSIIVISRDAQLRQNISRWNTDLSDSLHLIQYEDCNYVNLNKITSNDTIIIWDFSEIAELPFNLRQTIAQLASISVFTTQTNNIALSAIHLGVPLCFTHPLNLQNFIQIIAHFNCIEKIKLNRKNNPSEHISISDIKYIITITDGTLKIALSFINFNTIELPIDYMPCFSKKNFIRLDADLIVNLNQIYRIKNNRNLYFVDGTYLPLNQIKYENLINKLQTINLL